MIYLQKTKRLEDSSIPTKETLPITGERNIAYYGQMLLIIQALVKRLSMNKKVIKVRLFRDCRLMFSI